jgi:hypothetical protein
MSERTFAKIEKLDVAEQLVLWLDKRGLKITYGEFGRIVGHPAPYVGDLLDEVNRRHKARGGKDMLTTCVTDRFGHVGDGYATCKTELGLG